MPHDEDDPWSTGILRSPSPPSDAEDDELVAFNGFVQLSRDTDDLASELDLSRRQDSAVVKETPFTLAKLRAQQQDMYTGSERRSGGPVRTAADDAEPTPAPAPKRKRKIVNTGWTDSNGEALDAGPITKKGKRDVQSETTAPVMSRKESAPTPTLAKKAVKAPPKRGSKRILDGADKVEFHKLPTITSHSDFPILAGLERQHQLSKKKAAKIDASTRTPRSTVAGPSKPRQNLDLDALIGSHSFKRKGKARRRSPPPSPPSSEAPLTLAEALEKEFGPPKVAVIKPPPAQTKLLPAPKRIVKQSSPQTSIADHTCARGSDALDLTTLHSTSTNHSPVKDISPTEAGGKLKAPAPPIVATALNASCTSSTIPVKPSLMRPVAVRPSNVQLLETLAAGHGLPDSNLKPAHPHGVRRVLSSPTVVIRIKQADALPPSEDAETVLLMRRDPHNRRQLEVSAASSGPPPFDRHGTSPFEQAAQPDDGYRPIRSSYHPCHDKHNVKGSHRYSARELDRHRSYDVAPTQPHQAWRSGPQRNNVDCSDFGLQSPPGNKVHHRQWNPSMERRNSGTPYRRTLDGHYRSQSPDGTHSGCGGDVYSGLSTAPATEAHESPFSDTGAILDNVGGTALTSLPFSPSRAYGTPLKPSADHPPPNLSPPSIANRHSPFTLPISNNRSRRHPPLTGPWHKVLGSPSPPAVAEEWSTLPKRPHRMTLHPDASHPKRSKFRLPINLLSGRKMPQGRSQSPSPSNGLYSGAVTITKWSPSALSQPPERSVPQCRYVPPGMRALEMGSSREPPRDHQLPRAVNTSYITPRSSRVHPDSYAPSDHPHLDLNRVQSRTTAAYPTPRSIMPSPASEAGEERDKDDDWAMAWRLSANGRGAIRPSR